MIPSPKNLVLAGATAFVMLATSAFSAQYALVVGINHYLRPGNDLSGCLRDVQNMTDFLRSQGFPQENIVVLKDAQATAAGIEGAFKSHLIAKAQPGDSVVFFYSGHGTQVPDLEDDPDEDDDADESLCAYDINPRQQDTWVTDDRIRGLVSKLKTDRVLVMFDCCHSGTGTRGFSGMAAVPGAKYMHLGFDRPERVTRNFAISQAMRSPGTVKGHTLLAACTSAEVARDAGAAKGGIFTALFLAEAQQNPSVPLKSILQKVNAKVADFIQHTSSPSDTQTPQLEGAGDATVAEFFGAKPSNGFTQAAATAPPPPAAPTAPSVSATASTTTTTAPAAPQSAFPLSLTAGQEYQSGDFMTCTINSAKEGYLRLYYTDSEQKTYMIFPNKFQQENKIAGGSNIQVPSTTAGFQLKVFYPKHLQGAAASTTAQEILSAVVSPTPFKDQAGDKWLGDSTFMEFNNQSRRKIITRGIEVVKNDAAIAHFIYSIHPPK